MEPTKYTDLFFFSVVQDGITGCFMSLSDKNLSEAIKNRRGSSMALCTPSVEHCVMPAQNGHMPWRKLGDRGWSWAHVVACGGTLKLRAGAGGLNYMEVMDLPV